jgi:cytochrome c2
MFGRTPLSQPPLVLAAAIAFLAVTLSAGPASAEDGKKLFDALCTACHTVGGGKRVGPDLKGVTTRRSEAWLIKFIKSSASLIKSGDAEAVKIFEEYQKMPMPDVAYSEAQIKDILTWIASASTAGDAKANTAAPAAPPKPKALAPPTEAGIQLGRDLFQGAVRLKNGGAACNSCHNVKNDAVIGGGILAKDLTQVFTRLGKNSEALGALLGTPPFPVMKQAYAKRPVTQSEMNALIDFLRDADANQQLQTPRDYGVKLVASGTGGFAVLLILYGLMWTRRKRRSVNQAIYDRQIQSS